MKVAPMTVTEFRKRLRQQSPSLRVEFRAFLLERRTELGLVSQEALGRRADHQRITPATLVRVFDRAASGSAGMKALAHIASALDLVNPDFLVDSFVRWRSRRGEPLPDVGGFSLDRERQRYHLASGTVLEGRGSRYRVVRPVQSRLNRSSSYEVEVLGAAGDVKSRAFLKTLELSAEFSHGRRNELVSRARERLAEEAALLHQVRGIKGLAEVKDFAAARLVDEDGHFMQVPFVVFEWVEGKDLEALIASADPKDQRAVSRMRGNFRSYVRELLTTVRELHRRGVQHGDISTANIMLDPDGEQIKLVDFGESRLHSPEARPARRSSVPTVSQTGGAIGKPLEARDDVADLGAAIYYMASGKKIRSIGEVDPHRLRMMIDRQLKRAIREGLQVESGLPFMLTQALREATERAADAGELLDILDIFDRMEKDRVGRLVPERQFERSLDSLQSAWKKRGDDSLFLRLIKRQTTDDLDRHHYMLQHRRMEVEGTRNRLINSLMNLMASLSRGNDRFVTATAPFLWSRNNLGESGRFLEANFLMAKRNVRLKRLIVITKEDLKRPEDTIRMLHAQARLAARLKSEGIRTDDPDINSPGLFIAAAMHEDCDPRILADGFHVAFAQRADNPTVSLSFRIDREHQVRALTLWEIASESFVKARLELIGKQLRQAIPINDGQTIRELLARRLPHSDDRSPSVSNLLERLGESDSESL